MTDPASSGAAGAAAFKAVGGASAVAAGGASLAAEAWFRAAEQAVLTHGGMGYAQEYHVERLFREVMLPRIAPLSRELVLSYLAERVLGHPKSY